MKVELLGVEITDQLSLPLQIKVNCPQCGTECERDYSKRKISHYITGCHEPVFLFCTKCNRNFNAGTVRLTMQAEFEQNDLCG